MVRCVVGVLLSAFVCFLGTCQYQTAKEYYEIIEQLYKSLQMPNNAALKNGTQSSIRKAFLTLNPNLTTATMLVSMNSDNRLKEVKICYDLNHQLVRCSM